MLGTLITLNNGFQMPAQGFGVFQSAPEEAKAAVLEALKVGYRHIDTAAAYLNEREVGQAIAESGIPREEIFVETKVWITDYGYEETLHAWEKASAKLGLDYIDLLILHQPAPGTFDATIQAYKALETLLEQGKVRAIDVFNFYTDRYLDLVHHFDVVPAINQREIHPFNQQQEIFEYSKENGTILQAWGAVGQGNQELLTQQVLLDAASAHGKSVQQIMLRWHVSSPTRASITATRGCSRGCRASPSAGERAKLPKRAQVFRNLSPSLAVLHVLVVLHLPDLLAHVLAEVRLAEIIGERQPQLEVGAQAQLHDAAVEHEVHEVSAPGSGVVHDVGVAPGHRDARLEEGGAEAAHGAVKVLEADDLLAVGGLHHGLVRLLLELDGAGAGPGEVTGDAQGVHVVGAGLEAVHYGGEFLAAHRAGDLLADVRHEVGDHGVRGVLLQLRHGDRAVRAQAVARAVQDDHLAVQPVKRADAKRAVPEQLRQGHLVLVHALGK